MTADNTHHQEVLELLSWHLNGDQAKEASPR